MGSEPSDGPGDGPDSFPHRDRQPAQDTGGPDEKGSLLAAFKIVIAGGFGAGKTTLVGAVSEVRPLRTEETLSRGSIGLDDLGGVDSKSTTTVAMDFGRITVSSRLVLYLFGTPGQERFWFMWDELAYGALGAVVLADTRRLGDCFPSVDYFEKCRLPFIVGINCFDDSPQYDPEDVRVALDLDQRVPVMLCDAREFGSVKQVLITLVEHVLATRPLLLQGRPEPGSLSGDRPDASAGGGKSVPAGDRLNVMSPPAAAPEEARDTGAPPAGLPAAPRLVTPVAGTRGGADPVTSPGPAAG